MSVFIFGEKVSMLVFFILWLLILVAAWDKENEISFWSILLVFSVLIGFRSLTVGVDIKAYYQMFHMVGRNGYHGYPEPLYGYLIYFIYIYKVILKRIDSIIKNREKKEKFEVTFLKK